MLSDPMKRHNRRIMLERHRKRAAIMDIDYGRGRYESLKLVKLVKWVIGWVKKKEATGRF